MRVLLLEHDPLCAFDYIAALEANGHDVIGPAARVAEGVRLLKRRRIDLALIDLHLGLDHGLDLVQYAAAAGVACIAVTGYPLEATQASDRLLGCLPKPAAGEQIAELVGWFEGACAGSREAPPSTFMFFGATLPPMPMIHRSAQGASRARPATMPKRIRRSLT